MRLVAIKASLVQTTAAATNMAAEGRALEIRLDQAESCSTIGSPIPGRGCFGDLPGDIILVSPPPQSLKHSRVHPRLLGWTGKLKI